MRNFYCKDCEALIGQVGEDDIAVRCPKCRSLNNSANAVESPKQQKQFSRMNTAELESAAIEMEVDISGCKNNKERAAKLADAIKL